MYTLQIQTKYVFHSESPNILKVLTSVPTYLTKYESGQCLVFSEHSLSLSIAPTTRYYVSSLINMLSL